MRTLPAIQAILAAAFLLFGVVTLFGIGITGLLFLVPGAVFALTAALAQQGSRGGVALALALDGWLAYAAAFRLGTVLAADPVYQQVHHVGAIDYLVPAAALLIVAAAFLAVAMEWRALKRARWF